MKTNAPPPGPVSVAALPSHATASPFAPGASGSGAEPTYERRYHATWLTLRGQSPLSVLGRWICRHPRQLAAAPLDLLGAALADVASRLPAVAAREPTRRHKKHFAWLLAWHARIADAIEARAP